MPKRFYQHFINSNPNVQHYAAHSHHYWPDVTRHAMLHYWDDSATYVDDKWDLFFSKKIPAVQKLIADVLNISKPKQIVFAPNTHEFIYRLFSCFDPEKKLKVLTTDSEFYSFDRQVNRLSESGEVEVYKVAVTADFEADFIRHLNASDYDMVFLSHVFFNSGFVVKDLAAIVKAVKNPKTMIVIDGYHSFMAVPTDLAEIESRVFYISGSYKYAQGGEGCCFMVVPPDCELRPRYTGWFAGFAELTVKASEVLYSDDGYRFAGSTMDFSALYRLLAVLELFEKEHLTVAKIHKLIQKMQKNFREHLFSLRHPFLNEKNLLRLDYASHGHFYAFEIGDAVKTKDLYDLLKENRVHTDFRGTRLRFGFGLYQEDCIDLEFLRNK